MRRFHDLLNELLLDLREDCNAFDQGIVRKSKDIAGRIRTIVKDGRRNTISLLTHLDRKDILFTDSSLPIIDKPNFSFFDLKTNITNTAISVSQVHMGLIFKILESEGGKLKFTFAPLSLRKIGKPKLKFISFDDWWEGQVIYRDFEHNLSLTRGDLILSAADQDGFAHVDKNLNPEYLKFLSADSLEMRFNNELVLFSNSPAKVSIRQIGYELIHTLEHNLGDLIIDPWRQP